MPDDIQGDSETDSAATRWRFTNDALAGVIVLSLVGLVSGSVILNYSLPGEVWTVFVLVVALAAVWAFGRQTVGAAKSLLGRN